MEFLSRVFSPPSEKAVIKRYRATWNDTVLADSADTVVVEGNQYFPLGDVRQEYVRPSDSHTTCHWKGVASYYDVVVGDKVNRDAAWYYPNPFSCTPTPKRVSGLTYIPRPGRESLRMTFIGAAGAARSARSKCAHNRARTIRMTSPPAPWKTARSS